MVGNESLEYDLRILTAIQLFQNSAYYANYNGYFDKVAAELKNTCSNNLFCQSLSDIGCNKFTESKCRFAALKEEATYVANKFNWSSFVCVLAVCNVIKEYGQCSNLEINIIYCTDRQTYR